MNVGHSTTTAILSKQPTSAAPFPDPGAGPIRGDGVQSTEHTTLSGDASRYGYATKEYENIDLEPTAEPYSLPGGPNPRYGGKASQPTKDGLEGLAPCSTADQGPDGTEKRGRFPEPGKPWTPPR